MIRRGMRTIAHRLILLLAATLALAAPAGAAEVARIDGATLDASVSTRAGFCLRLSLGTDGRGGGSGTCGRAPWRPRRAELVTWQSGGRLLVAGAVPAAVTHAEAELVDGRRVGFDTVPGAAYKGRYAGKLRFFLAAVPLADPQDEDTGGLVLVRFSDAAGAIVGAAGAPARASRWPPRPAGIGCWSATPPATGCARASTGCAPTARTARCRP